MLLFGGFGGFDGDPFVVALLDEDDLLKLPFVSSFGTGCNWNGVGNVECVECPLFALG